LQINQENVFFIRQLTALTIIIIHLLFIRL